MYERFNDTVNQHEYEDCHVDFDQNIYNKNKNIKHTSIEEFWLILSCFHVFLHLMQEQPIFIFYFYFFFTLKNVVKPS